MGRRYYLAQTIQKQKRNDSYLLRDMRNGLGGKSSKAVDFFEYADFHSTIKDHGLSPLPICNDFYDDMTATSVYCQSPK